MPAVSELSHFACAPVFVYESLSYIIDQRLLHGWLTLALPSPGAGAGRVPARLLSVTGNLPMSSWWMCWHVCVWVCVLSEQISACACCFRCREYAEEQGKGNDIRKVCFRWSFCTNFVLFFGRGLIGIGVSCLISWSGCCFSWISHYPCENTHPKQERELSHLWSDLLSYFSHQRSVDLTLTAAHNYDKTPSAAALLGFLLMLFSVSGPSRWDFQMSNVTSACSDQWAGFHLDPVSVCMWKHRRWLVLSLHYIPFLTRRVCSMQPLKAFFWGQICLSCCV